MTALKVHYLAEARREVIEAFNWYFDRSPQAAGAFVHELERAVRLVRETPEVWPAFERETRRYVLQRFPYSLIYRLCNNRLEVVAVAHAKRRPGYWHSRSDA